MTTNVLATDSSARELDNQFRSLMKNVDNWIARSPAIGDQPDAPRIFELLTNFKGFFADYYAYFVRRANEGDFDGQRTPADVLRRVIRHMLEQGATLTRLLAQRQSGSLYRDALVQADGEAKTYYDRYQGAKLGGSEPLVLFEKLYHITRFPFRPPPLIAIPLVDWDRPQAWLPLAHELGHYVFWNSADLDVYRQVHDAFRGIVEEHVEKFLAGDPQPEMKAVQLRWLAWLEETFADIFGALVAGPDYAREAQNRLIRETLSTDEDLLLDDAEHPMPIIRPLIASEVLKHRTESGAQIAEALEKRWEPYLKRAEEVFERVKAEATADAPVLPSPKKLASTVATLVEGLLTQPVLQFQLKSRAYKPLLELVPRWEPDQSDFRVHHIAMIQAEAALPLLPQASRAGEPRVKKITDETDGTVEAFSRLRDFVREEIRANREQRTEWEALLTMELESASEADHTVWQTHSHSVYHKHDYYNRARCC